MKGVIFNVFEDFVITKFGEDVLEDIVDATTLQTTEPFVGPGTYPATDLLALVATAADLLGITVDEALRAYGRHAFPALAGAVPTLMEQFSNPSSFLLGLESVIHTEVRKLDAEASPARFRVEAAGPAALTMHYESPFGLFGLVHGLLDGVGDWFEADFQHEMIKAEGTNASFAITFDTLETSMELAGAQLDV